MSDPQPITIILAEDDDGHASLVERNLERAGLLNGFLRVKDGQELLDVLKAQGTPDGPVLSGEVVILLDINMPRIDGIEALKQIKANDATKSIPVIMLTTTDDPREVNRCYELGANVYITKPVEYDNFIEAIRRLGLFLQIVKRPRNGWNS
ncbi:MAG TPA: response regulator [Chthoniobacteraceae bacterium]|jgi:CheY-like chemotaxis protein|nr:response regulator [Chthoniobacteraceae bacterium]